VAVRRDLYTLSRNGSDSDEIERWLNAEFEQPGLDASERLLAGSRLTKADWEALIKLYALQEFRTPSSFILFMQRWEKTLPNLIQETLASIAQAVSAPLFPEEDTRKSEEFARLSKIVLHDPEEGNGGGRTLEASITAGRGLWMYVLKYLMSGRSIERLLSHEWSILTPYGSAEWPITDHPSVRVAFNSLKDYSFDGGFGKRNNDLFMPLSPRHLLFAQVGKKHERYFTATLDHTIILQTLLVRRAHRYVFATAPSNWIEQLRPRTVDADLTRAEQEGWQRWHSEQIRAEASNT
jgi:hypothetical protein